MVPELHYVCSFQENEERMKKIVAELQGNVQKILEGMYIFKL